MSLITVKDLSIGYEGKTVTENINFEIEEKDYLCIVGENGAGKTTLLRTLLNLNNPIKGEIIYGELNKNDIGYLPQVSPIQADFPASVKEIVLSGFQGKCGLRPFYNREEKEKAYENIRQMELEPYKNKPFSELSGGLKQRVLLSRALCSTNKLLYLDEPITGLDPIMTEKMYGIIKDLNDKGIAIVMISHDINEALNDAKHILHIGKQSFYGTVEEYMNCSLGKKFLNNRERGDI